MIREAASVVLLRAKKQQGEGSAFEVFLLRRQKAASFMASAFVFPGGGAEEGEDARTTAARELFEEAGVLLAHDLGSEAETVELMSLQHMRKRMLAGVDATKLLATAGLAWSTDVLAPWSHWITPSIEPKRFSARFFIAELPPGQKPEFDAVETVEQTWVSPEEALARAGELALPPPQVRTFWELSHHRTIAEVRAAAKLREAEPHPIMPRIGELSDGSRALLLPWDPEYTTVGTGEGTPLTYQPSWAIGPSRFVKEGSAWKHVSAPGSTPTG